MNTVFVEPLPLVYSGGEPIATALAELVRNATQSKGVRHIDLRVQIEPLDDRLKIEVRDDGESESESDGLQAA